MTMVYEILRDQWAIKAKRSKVWHFVNPANVDILKLPSGEIIVDEMTESRCDLPFWRTEDKGGVEVQHLKAGQQNVRLCVYCAQGRKHPRAGWSKDD